MNVLIRQLDEWHIKQLIFLECFSFWREIMAMKGGGWKLDKYGGLKVAAKQGVNSVDCNDDECTLFRIIDWLNFIKQISDSRCNSSSRNQVKYRPVFPSLDSLENRKKK